MNSIVLSRRDLVLFRSNQEVVEEAFLPTLKTLLNAPGSSPLQEVDVNNVAELLVQLTNTKLITQNQNKEDTNQVENLIFTFLK